MKITATAAIRFGDDYELVSSWAGISGDAHGNVELYVSVAPIIKRLSLKGSYNFTVELDPAEVERIATASRSGPFVAEIAKLKREIEDLKTPKGKSPAEVLRFAREAFKSALQNLLDDPSGVAGGEAKQVIGEQRKMAATLGLDFDALAAELGTPYERDRLAALEAAP